MQWLTSNGLIRASKKAICSGEVVCSARKVPCQIKLVQTSHASAKDFGFIHYPQRTRAWVGSGGR
jgi:hypothetical protein